MHHLRNDLSYALRQLLRNPGFAGIAVLTLALGIGANTAIFSVVNGVLLKPLPFPEPDRVTYLGWDWGGGPQGALSAWKLEYWREHSRVFEGVATANTMLAELEAGDFVDDVAGLRVSEDFFAVIGVHPTPGRGFTPEEALPGGAEVAVIGHGLWQTRFGADPDVVGRIVRIDDVAHTVIGVLPEEFAFPQAPGNTNLLVPLRLNPDPRDETHNHVAFARLASDVSWNAAASEMSMLSERFRQEHPGLVGDEEVGMGFQSYQDLYVGSLQRTLWILLSAVGLVLLIACANVASLLLGRAASRRQELATRAALGAGRRRIVSQLLTESLVLALIAGVAGLVVGTWSVQVLLALLPDGLPRMAEIGLELRVLGFTFALAVVTGVVFGLVAAIPASRTELTPVLRGGASGGRAGRMSLSGMLVAGEVALAIVLLSGAALLTASFLQLRTVDTGFNPRNIVTVDLGKTPPGYESGAPIASLEELLSDHLRGVPGVTAVASATNLPLQRGWNIPITLEGRPDATEGDIEWRAIGPEYFAVLEIPVLEGRSFDASDHERAVPVVIVNEATARHYWPDEDPIGRRVSIGAFRGENVMPGPADPVREVVGVVGDVREIGLARVPRRTVYVPQAQAHGAMVASLPRLLIRTSRPELAAGALHDAVRQADPRLRDPVLGSMDDVLAASIAQERFDMVLLGSFALTALLLTMIGIFGVVSHSVRRRTREIGIRIALGANVGRVRRMIVREGMRSVGIGIVLGLLAAFVLTRLLSGMLYGIEPGDPWVLGAVALLLAIVALGASHIPATRATRVDPLLTLKAD